MLKEQAEWTAALLCTPGGPSGMCIRPDDLKVQLPAPAGTTSVCCGLSMLTVE